VNSETDPRYPDGCLLLLTPNTGTPSPRSCACHSPVGHYQFSKIRRYGYDDITRITNANCGSAAAQTFSFDAFGKNQQGGSPFSFTPTYSAATNRMASIDGFTPTYHSMLARPTRFTRRFRIMARDCRKNDWQRFNPQLSGWRGIRGMRERVRQSHG